MVKTRDIMRLHKEAGLGLREIGRSLGISHSTVKDHLMRAEAAGLPWLLPEEMNDEVLEQLLFPRNTVKSRLGLEPDFKHIHKELKRKDVTLQLLWLEYKREYPDGYQYSHFCELYQKWRQDLDVSMRGNHKAGEKLFVDWAGQTVPITDKKTGETRPAYLFVAVLGASNYTYAEASLSQDLSSWINAHCRTLAYLGGVPHIIVPDNTKTAVNKVSYYEPELNATYQEMAAHYGTVIIPARPYKPRDKTKVEIGVQIAERWLLAPLRNRAFFSVNELNTALWSILVEINTRPF